MQGTLTCLTHLFTGYEEWQPANTAKVCVLSGRGGKLRSELVIQDVLKYIVVLQKAGQGQELKKFWYSSKMMSLEHILKCLSSAVKV